MPRLSLICAVSLCFQLTACGGGGSSSTPPPAPVPTPTPVPATTGIVSVSSQTPDGVYSTGHAVDIAVKFQQPVTVSGGIPTLELDTRQGDPGTADAALSTPPLAAYASGSGSDTLVFHYVIQAADRTVDLDYRSTASLALNGAQIHDASDTPVKLTLPTPGSANSLQQTAHLQMINWTGPHQVETGLFSVPATRTFALTPGGNSLTLDDQQVSADSSELHAVLTETSTGAVRSSLVLASMNSTAQFDDAMAYALSDGSALVFWTIRSTATGFQNLYSCHFRTDGSCSAVVDLGNKPSTLTSGLHVGRELDGRIHALWVGNGLSDGFYDLATESWSAVRTLVPSDAMFDAKYLEDAQGNWAVIWPRSGSHHLSVLRFIRSTGLWSGVTAIESLNGFAEAPSAVLDPDGNIAVLWEQRWSTPTTGVGQMAAAYLDAATGVWTPASFVSPGPTSAFKNYQLPRQGSAIVAAWNDNGRFYTADYAAAAKTWSTAVVVDGGVTIEGTPAVRIDADGGRAILWFNRRPTGTYDLYGRYFSHAVARWGTPVRLMEGVVNGGTLPVLDDGVTAWSQLTAPSVYARWEIGMN